MPVASFFISICFVIGTFAIPVGDLRCPTMFSFQINKYARTVRQSDSLIGATERILELKSERRMSFGGLSVTKPLRFHSWNSNWAWKSSLSMEHSFQRP